jgi:cell division protein FtsN
MPIAPAADTAQPVPQVTKLEVAQAAPSSPATPVPAAQPALVHGFYVNVGVFAVAQNANTVRGKLDGTGLPIVADTVKAKDAQATRIRVGPFAKRAQAQAAAKKIHALKLDAVVVRH